MCSFPKSLSISLNDSLSEREKQSKCYCFTDPGFWLSCVQNEEPEELPRRKRYSSLSPIVSSLLPFDLQFFLCHFFLLSIIGFRNLKPKLKLTEQDQQKSPEKVDLIVSSLPFQLNNEIVRIVKCKLRSGPE